MSKILVGLILGILICMSIIFDFFDKLMLLSILVGIYELISNYLKSKKDLGLISIGIFILLIIFYIIYNKELKLNELIFILGITIISDVFQELSGKYFGKNKIGWISPNKTYEGYIGGYIGILMIYFIKLHTQKQFKFFDLNLIYILGIFGDLFFSYIKRNIGVKDYSEILLSHGGVLDRLDAFYIAVLGYGYYNIMLK